MDKKDVFAIAFIVVSEITAFMAGRNSMPEAKLVVPAAPVMMASKSSSKTLTVDEETFAFIKRWQAAAEADRTPVVSVEDLPDAGQGPISSASAPVPQVLPAASLTTKPIASVSAVPSALPSAKLANIPVKPAASAPLAPSAAPVVPHPQPEKIVLEDDPTSIPNPYK